METGSTVEARTGQAGGGVQMRAHLHGMWAAVAPAWGEHSAYADARGAEVAEEMLGLALPVAGERVLELACGPGGLGLAAAARVGPDGEVVLSDVVAEMTSIAGARADAPAIQVVHDVLLADHAPFAQQQHLEHGQFAR